MTHNGYTGISSIAVALDGSPLSSSALPMVKDLARAFHARIILISVLDPAVGERFAEFVRAEGVELADAMRAYQHKLIEELRAEGLPAAGHVVVPEVSTAESIREVAEKLSASLLIIGSHGRTGVKRMFLGSVAEELTRNGSIPVLVVTPMAMPVAVD